MFSKKKENRKSGLQVDFNLRARYSMDVELYLERNRTKFLEEWADICGKTNGRVSYEELYEVLGKDFPKAPWNDPENINANIKAFFGELGFPCIADDTHIYFP